MNPENELLATAPDKGVDINRLSAFLAGRMDKAQGQLEVRQFSGGNANLLYLLRYPQASYVLRRPPFGTLAPGSHDMNREYRVLSRLHDAYSLAPRAFLVCNDKDVIGTSFLIMEYRPGVVIRRELPRELVGDPRSCRLLGETIIDALAALHEVKPEAVGLGELGNPDSYLQRQMEGWERRWAAVADHNAPAVDAIARWLNDNLPETSSVALLHNDFKLDNMLLAPQDLTKCVAVVDWDMCTRGDPLAELGFLLNYWGEAKDPEEWLNAASMPTWHPGFPSRSEAIARYAERTGINVDALPWHRVFGVYKLAVILQQIWMRYVRGDSSNQRFAVFGQRVETLICKAQKLIAQA